MRPAMTLSELVAVSAVDELVGVRPSKRWGRASLVTRRSDGHSIASWFELHSPAERTQIVRDAMCDGAPWSRLLGIGIPKASGTGDVRYVCLATVLDQARLYLLGDWLAKYAETTLTKVASAFRAGVRTSQVILNAQRRLRHLPFAAVLDIEGFFDSISWRHVDNVVDSLPAHPGVQRLLSEAARTEVLDRHSGVHVERSQGIPQGLSISPTLANLVLNDFDQHLAHALSRRGACVRRYCDDLLLLTSSRRDLEWAIAVAEERLDALGFRTRAGTQATDTREVPVRWLGVAIGTDAISVPPAMLERKSLELQARLDRGLLGAEGLEGALIGLEQYYRRIVGAERARAAIASIAGGLRVPSRHQQGKEDTDRLRQLSGHDQYRGSHAASRTTRAQPDGRGTDRDLGDGSQEHQTRVVSSTTRFAALRVESSKALDPGAPVRSAPAILENSQAEWRLAAFARGRRALIVTRRADADRRDAWFVEPPRAVSPSEIVLLGLAAGLQRLAVLGVRDVTVIVFDVTLAGYLRAGWRPRSLRMVQALRTFLDSANTLNLRWEFVPTDRKQTR